MENDYLTALSSTEKEDVNFCRLCLTREGDFQHLFSGDKTNAVILDNLLYCMRLELNPIENYKDRVCAKCIDMLDQCTSFIQKCLFNNQILLHKIENEILEGDPFSEIKEEPHYDQSNDSDNSFEVILSDDTEPEVDANDTDNSIDKQWEQLPSITPKPFKCRICNLAHPRIAALRVHMRRHNENREKFPCTFCDKQLLSEKTLQMHIHNIHQGEKKYACSTCGQKYGSWSGLQYHEKTHRNVRDFICATCGAAFFLNTSLMTHMETHTNRSLPCKVCNKLFATKNNLKRHQIVHAEERKHSCNICRKKFKVPSHLKHHMVTHTGEKPYKCTLCAETFSFDSQRSVHVKKKHLLC